MSEVTWKAMSIKQFASSTGMMIQVRPEEIAGVKSIFEDSPKQIGALNVATNMGTGRDEGVEFTYITSGNGTGVKPLLKLLDRFRTKYTVIVKTEGKVLKIDGRFRIMVCEKRPFASGFHQFVIEPEADFATGRITRVTKSIFVDGIQKWSGQTKRPAVYELNKIDFERFEEVPEFAKRIVGAHIQSFELMEETPAVFVKSGKITATGTFRFKRARYALKLVNPSQRVASDQLVLIRLKSAVTGLESAPQTENLNNPVIFTPPGTAVGFLKQSDAAMACFEKLDRAIETKARELRQNAKKRRLESKGK